MTNAQSWLNKEYPLSRRNEITTLDLSKGQVKKWTGQERTLKGNLKLEGFTNLRVLKCAGQQLTTLAVNGCQYLTELDCSGNQLNSLSLINCSKLRKLNCFNNYLYRLDLTSCTELEEIDCLNNNLAELNLNYFPNLAQEKITSDLVYDATNNKLIKSNTPLIKLATENEVRNILIVGITGGGKSTLANVLTDDNSFAERDSSTSVTKGFQKSDIFTWQGKKFRVVDNIGFGDTAKITEADLLYKIGEGIYSAQEGLNQVLFVFKGRFTPEQVAAFNLFKEFIAESGIAKFTTLLRTNFPNFRNQSACENDRHSLLTESSELGAIINSCNGVIHVDNPSLSDTRRTQINLNKREQSREIILNHLAKNCSQIYKLQGWDSIYQRVVAYLQKKEAAEQKLRGRLTNAELKAEKKALADSIKFRLGLGMFGAEVAAETEIANPSCCLIS